MAISHTVEFKWLGTDLDGATDGDSVTTRTNLGSDSADLVVSTGTPTKETSTSGHSAIDHDGSGSGGYNTMRWTRAAGALTDPTLLCLFISDLSTGGYVADAPGGQGRIFDSGPNTVARAGTNLTLAVDIADGLDHVVMALWNGSSSIVWVDGSYASGNAGSNHGLDGLHLGSRENNTNNNGENYVMASFLSEVNLDGETDTATIVSWMEGAASDELWSTYGSDLPGLSAPSGGVNLEIPVGSMSIAGLAPGESYGLSLGIPVGSLSIAGLAPSVVAGYSQEIPTGTIGIQGQSPALANGHVLEVPSGSMSIEGQSLTLHAGYVEEVPQALLTIAGLAPQTHAGIALEIAVGVLNINALAPQLAAGVVQEIGIGELSITGLAGLFNPQEVTRDRLEARLNVVRRLEAKLGINSRVTARTSVTRRLSAKLER